jgi:hypothetical protein
MRIAKRPDIYQDYHETHQTIIEPGPAMKTSAGFYRDDENPEIITIPKLRECQATLHNETAAKHRRQSNKPLHRISLTVRNLIGAWYIYLINTIGLEAVLVVINSTIATYYYCRHPDDFAVKLDFSFLAFSVVFPLTFLIQSTFARREMALSRLADFKSCILSTALFSLLTDWPTSDGQTLTGGRLAMPEAFNEQVIKDCKDLVQLVYEYLSMPSVSHARNIICPSRQIGVRRVHALQNDIVKRLNDSMFDFALHTETMRKYGFPSGEASRLHQYHQYLQQRFEQLRILKYYRTPQATRSFGRVYIFVLPWLTGPYFAWVNVVTGYIFTLCLAAFTFLILLGLMNIQQELEDPFVPLFTSLTPGIDTVKLDFEMAVVLQALDQYYAQAKLRRLFRIAQRKRLQEEQEVAQAVAAESE